LGNAPASSVPLAPAWERYDGNLYRKAQLGEADIHRKDVTIVIISALFGVICADDTIRHYNVAMTDRLPDRTRVYAFWSNIGLASILAKLLQNLAARRVDDLLSGSYRKALGRVDTLLPAGCIYQPWAYPRLGSGSDYHRGTDVRKLLAVGPSGE
jgi:cytoplasmic iron level regulating protein YaaA (DUF328/UPF0246 family)